MVRQRILERAGWEIWRCFASRFVRDRVGVLAELLALLHQRGIEPVGAGEGWVSRHTEHRRWRTPPPDDGIIVGDAEPEAEEDGGTEEDSSISPSINGFDGQNSTPRHESVPTDPAEDLFGASPIPTGPTGSRVSEAQVQIEIVRLMRDGRPWTNADLKRTLISILPLSPADRARANFRPNEEKWEELVNNALSPSRTNSLHAKGLVRSAGRGLHVLSEATNMEKGERAQREDVRPSLPMEVFREVTKQQIDGFIHLGSRQYMIADSSAIGIELNPEALYEIEYRSTLRRLVAHVISVEGPIYDDILAVRIARAHGKDRTGRIIRQLAVASVDRRFPRTREDDRDLFWPEGAQTDTPFPYRPSPDGLRSHADIPLAELASIALPFVNASLSDEEVIQKMAKNFELERIRQATRRRFVAALSLAKRCAVL